MEEAMACKTDSGEAAFWWLGQSGFLIKLGNTLLCIDAYFENDFHRLHPPLLLANELADVDYVLGTHDHVDHIDRTSWAIIADACPATNFIVPSMHIGVLTEATGIKRNRFIGLDDGAPPFEKDGIAIYGIPSAHEFLDRDPQTGCHPYLGYIVKGNGVTLYHSGDSLIYEGLEAKLRQHAPLDIMFLPINGRDGVRYRANCIGNMTFQEAVDLTGALHPGLAVPSHYDMFAGNLANPFDYTDYLEAKFPDIPFWVGGHGVKVLYSRKG